MEREWGGNNRKRKKMRKRGKAERRKALERE